MMKIVAPGAMLLVAALASISVWALDARVSMTGFGEIQIGMTDEALEAVVGMAIAPPADEEEAACRYAFPDGPRAGMSFLLLDGRLARIDVDRPGILTSPGASVGDSEADIASLYGPSLRVSNHFYRGSDGKYLTVFSPDGKHGVRFETDGQIVTRYYVGTAQAIQYVEGCQ